MSKTDSGSPKAVSAVGFVLAGVIGVAVAAYLYKQGKNKDGFRFFFWRNLIDSLFIVVGLLQFGASFTICLEATALMSKYSSPTPIPYTPPAPAPTSSPCNYVYTSKTSSTTWKPWDPVNASVNVGDRVCWYSSSAIYNIVQVTNYGSTNKTPNGFQSPNSIYQWHYTFNTNGTFYYYSSQVPKIGWGTIAVKPPLPTPAPPTPPPPTPSPTRQQVLGLTKPQALLGAGVFLCIEALVSMAIATYSMRLHAPWDVGYTEPAVTGAYGALEGGNTNKKVFPPVGNRRGSASVTYFVWGVILMLSAWFPRVILMESEILPQGKELNLAIVYFTVVTGFLTFLAVFSSCSRDTWWGRDEYVTYVCPECNAQSSCGSRLCKMGTRYQHA